jgi:hypothetical protein
MHEIIFSMVIRKLGEELNVSLVEGKIINIYGVTTPMVYVY